MNEQAIEWSSRFAVEKCFSDVWWRFISAEKCDQPLESDDRLLLGVTDPWTSKWRHKLFPKLCSGSRLCAVHIIFLYRLFCLGKHPLRSPENYLFLNKLWNLEPCYFGGGAWDTLFTDRFCKYVSDTFPEALKQYLCSLGNIISWKREGFPKENLPKSWHCQDWHKPTH